MTPPTLPQAKVGTLELHLGLHPEGQHHFAAASPGKHTAYFAIRTTIRSSHHLPACLHMVPEPGARGWCGMEMVQAAALEQPLPG